LVRRSNPFLRRAQDTRGGDSSGCLLRAQGAGELGKLRASIAKHVPAIVKRLVE